MKKNLFIFVTLFLLSHSLYQASYAHLSLYTPHEYKKNNANLFDNTQKIITLNPAGDAQKLGRKLANGYERGTTLKLAEALEQKLKNEIKNKKPHSNTHVVLARTPGQAHTQLETAAFANRLKTNFFISVHVYHEKTPKPKIFLYQRVTNPLTDFTPRTFDTLSFLPVTQAHLPEISTSRTFGEKLKTHLSQKDYLKQFDTYGLFGIPLNTLKGVTAPALTIEIGINQDNKWHVFIDPLAEGILALLGNLSV